MLHEINSDGITGSSAMWRERKCDSDAQRARLTAKCPRWPPKRFAPVSNAASDLGMASEIVGVRRARREPIPMCRMPLSRRAGQRSSTPIRLAVLQAERPPVAPRSRSEGTADRPMTLPTNRAWVPIIPSTLQGNWRSSLSRRRRQGLEGSVSKRRDRPVRTTATARSTRNCSRHSLCCPLHSVFTDGRISGGGSAKRAVDHRERKCLKWGALMRRSRSPRGTQSERCAAAILSRLQEGSTLRPSSTACCRSYFHAERITGATASRIGTFTRHYRGRSVSVLLAEAFDGGAKFIQGRCCSV